jgi:HAD superfamily hydrolase (TIGR01509 family)
MHDRRHRGRFELVIFDCDGVLIDSERLLVPIDAAILNELGWPITESEVAERFLGRSAAECDLDIERRLGRPIPAEVQAEVDRRYEEAFRTSLEPVEGVVDVLDALDRAGIDTCVASSSSWKRLQLSLGLTGLLARFDGRIFSADEVARGKPEPDLFLLAAERLGADPTRSAVVEDSPYGIEAALRAQMTPFAYLGGLVPGERLTATGARGFSRMRDLPPLLLCSEPDALGEELPVVGGVAEDELG